MFTDVAIRRELHPGFEQAAFMEGRNRILLHKVMKDVPLKRHRHNHAQFGYNFWGTYLFTAENSAFNVKSGSRYLLSGLTHHAAYATTDYYSMDYKFISGSELPNAALFDPIGRYTTSNQESTNNVEVEHFKFNLSNNAISSIIRVLSNKENTFRLKMDQAKTNFLISGSKTQVYCNDMSAHLEIMRIYKISPIDHMTLKFTDNSTEILILSI